ADTGTCGDADAQGIVTGLLQAGVPDRLHACGNAVMEKLVYAARFLGGDVLGDVEVAYRTTEARAECGHIEVGDRSDAAPAFTQSFPGVINGVTQRRDRPHSRNYHSSS